MAEQTTDEQKTPGAEPQEDSARVRPPRKSIILKTLPVIVIVLAVAVGVAYKMGVLKKYFPAAGSSEVVTKSEPAFTGIPPEKLLSTNQLLTSVGKAPGDQTDLQAGTQERSLTSEAEPKVESRAPEEDRAASPIPAEQPAVQAQQGAVTPSPGAAAQFAPKTVETPVIDSKVTSSPLERLDDGKGGQQAGPESPTPTDARKGPRKGNSEELVSGKTSVQEKSKKFGAGKGADGPHPAESKLPAQVDRGRPEQFQLPGSLLIRIHSYTGTTVKWGLMVILDDSDSMARQLKPWNPNRSEAAAGLVAKLAEVTTPGSRMAIRDFACGKSSDDKKKGRCLSHVLYEWNDAPFKQLKEKLQEAKPGGQTNPCAAAAFVAKQDLKGGQGLTPRILLVTNGAAKCDFKEVLKALDRTESKEKPVVDVVALGLSKKRERGYSTVAKKSGGVFLRADSPAEIGHVISRYEKILNTKAMEKVEVRGEKSVFTVNPGEELTLAPGSYTVVLPLVAGIQAPKRTVSNVKINSGEPNVMEVRVKKGKLTVQAGKK